MRKTSTAKTLFKIRLRKGDLVTVLSGREKGKTGKITAVHPALNKVTVEGLNIVTKHVKPNRTHPQGQLLKLSKPIWVSKLAIVEPSTKKPSRIGYTITKEGTKVRTFKRTGKEIKS